MRVGQFQRRETGTESIVSFAGQKGFITESAPGQAARMRSWRGSPPGLTGRDGVRAALPRAVRQARPAEIVVIWLSVILVFSAGRLAAEPPVDLGAAALAPGPRLGPRDVIRGQLESLRLNEADNRGIGRCFEFAAPSNRLVTGPLERFIAMVNSPRYRVMLNHRQALIGTPEISGDYAYVIATLADRDRQLAVFGFSLAKQKMAPYEGCWMTTGVDRILITSRVPSGPPGVPPPAKE